MVKFLDAIHEAIAFCAWLTIGPLVGLIHGVHWCLATLRRGVLSAASRVARWWFTHRFTTSLRALARFIDDREPW